MEKRGLERREIRREAAAAEEGGAVDMIRRDEGLLAVGRAREGRERGGARPGVETREPDSSFLGEILAKNFVKQAWKLLDSL